MGNPESRQTVTAPTPPLGQTPCRRADGRLVERTAGVADERGRRRPGAGTTRPPRDADRHGSPGRRAPGRGQARCGVQRAARRPGRAITGIRISVMRISGLRSAESRIASNPVAPCPQSQTPGRGPSTPQCSYGHFHHRQQRPCRDPCPDVSTTIFFPF